MTTIAADVDVDTLVAMAYEETQTAEEARFWLSEYYRKHPKELLMTGRHADEIFGRAMKALIADGRHLISQELREKRCQKGWSRQTTPRVSAKLGTELMAQRFRDSLLDLPVNGTIFRFCGKEDCSKVAHSMLRQGKGCVVQGMFFEEVGKKLKDNQTVGQRFDDKELRTILCGAQEGAAKLLGI